jgi:hypothetical protein
MARDPELIAHLEWLGYIQPVGLVVSAPALLQAQAHVNSNVIPQHQRFLACLPVDKDDEFIPQIEDFPAFVRQVLDWSEADLVAFDDAAKLGIDVSGLEVVLPEYNETLRPTWLVPEFKSAGAKSGPPTDASATTSAESKQPSNAERFVMLIQQVPTNQDLDEPQEETDRRWHASPHARFERLLRETQVPAGLLINGRQLRLVYAPRGETSGYLTFNVDELVTVAGRPMFAALHMLLNSDRLFNLEKKQRLPSILVESRKYQNIVSTQLAQQVMAAMYELLRGFQAADDQWNGKLLKDVLASNPQHVYHGLLTILMRSVFILYAEDRNLLSNHPVYTSYYSITGLFERLRADAGQYPDTMDQRYGAWAQLLTLFRMIYEGGNHGEFSIPPRKGYLFDPERYPFLEGGFGIGWLGPSKDVGTREDEVEAISNDVVSERRAEFSIAKKIASPFSTIPQPQTPSPQLTTNHSPLIPRVSDGVIYRVLNNLLILDGERLSYRSLDVEQIGSVYEAIMGFEVKVATGRSIAVKPSKKHGAPASINLEELLATTSSKRAAWLSEHSDQDLTGKSLESLKSAATIEELLAALGNKIASEVTPNVASAGAMIFQPSDERRRSGSHYTPRSLTEPIVRTTLEPILKQLCDPQSPIPDPYSPTKEDKKRYTQGEMEARVRVSERAIENARRARDIGTPHPSQILDLKVCDPAMGSGAFLVESCRQLGDELVKAWYAHDLVPTDIPPDEDELLYARRQIAQRCLYGVDKNLMAVDLAKLSLWLVTLAKDHAFTFLDHSLCHGDSLVGLTREQIIGFHWEPKLQKKFGEDLIQKRLDKATEARAKILNAREDVPYRDQEQRLALADEALEMIRMIGDACISAFFSGRKNKERENNVDELFGIVTEYVQSLTTDNFSLTTSLRSKLAAASLRSGEHPLSPFHWEIEFPEVFSRENGGFDAFIGNPPFMGGRKISTAFGISFFDMLRELYSPAGNTCDFVAYFFRRAFSLLRINGAFGLICTNTIAQGDTRNGGLTQIKTEGGAIFNAIRRYRWPGQAGVIVSIVHVLKQPTTNHRCHLDGKPVEQITSFLFECGGDKVPERLAENEGIQSVGSFVYGRGFIFDDTDPLASPISTMNSLMTVPRIAKRIKQFVGGEEINGSIDHTTSSRYVIFLSDIRDESELIEHPELTEIVREKVKPGRDSLGNNPVNKPLKKRWWAYQAHRPEFYEKIGELPRILAVTRHTKHFAITFVKPGPIFGESIVLFALPTSSAFALLQSRVHEVWARFFSSTIGDALRYSPTDCFDTFPMPKNVEELDAVGDQYFAYRRNLLLENSVGLTDIYNRFHDPHENSSEILHLRELHEAMDRAVLRAYGWDDLAATARCEFLLDYEDEGTGDSGLGVGEENQSLSPSPKSRRKLPWRLRWPDDFRDEVLARLLELNEQRHKEELLADGAPSAAKKVPKASTKKKTKKSTSVDQLELDLEEGN